MTTATRLASALESLRDCIASGSLGLELDGVGQARGEAVAIPRQINDYLLPRAQTLDAPLLVVVGGSTGAGKSTLVNSIVESNVSPTGVLRPTTRVPVLVAADADRDWFAAGRVLPGLARSTGHGDGSGALHLVTLPAIGPGLALLDAPDVDSVVETNRELAAQLLAAADLWLFVTTAARYADAVPWDLLHTARERGTALAVVLNRVPPEAVAEVEPDLRSMLSQAGLRDVRVFVIEETPLQEGRLADGAIAPLREWLRHLAADADARSAVVRQTLAGALDSLSNRVRALAQAIERQHLAATQLREAARVAYEGAASEVSDGVRSGTLLRGEVLARWHDFVGTGEWMRSLESRVGRVRDRVTAALLGRPTPVEELQAALESSVETILHEAANQAAEETVLAWRQIPGGRAILLGHERELERASAGFVEHAAREVRDWQGYVLDLVRSEGAGRRSSARFLSFGVNGAGLVVVLAVFASTGGLTGGELVVAGGTSALSQKLLEAVFGDAAVRVLAVRARDDLEERAARMLANERARFDALLAEVAPPEGAAAELGARVAELEAARVHTPA